MPAGNTHAHKSAVDERAWRRSIAISPKPTYCWFAYRWISRTLFSDYNCAYRWLLPRALNSDPTSIIHVLISFWARGLKVKLPRFSGGIFAFLPR